MLDLLFRRGSVTQADLLRLLDLSQSSVARLVGEFARDGIVTLEARRATGPGNPSVTVRLAPDHAYSLGVAIVGDAVSLAVIDLAGTVRAYDSMPMPDMAPALVADVLEDVAARLIAASGIDRTRLVGAGVGFSGYFVGTPPQFSPPPLLAGWYGIDMVGLLSERLGLPVICDNDATAATLYECLAGVGRTCPTFAYCHLTNGFGGGLVIDGRLVRSWMGNAGDFGGVWWLLDDGYPNLDLMRRFVNEAGAAYETVEAMVRVIGPETPGVEAWLRAAERPFAMLASVLGHTVSPEQVVIGGRLPTAIAAALSARIVLPRTPTRNTQDFPLPTIVPSEVEGDGVAIGAGLMPLRELFF